MITTLVGLPAPSLTRAGGCRQVLNSYGVIQLYILIMIYFLYIYIYTYLVQPFPSSPLLMLLPWVRSGERAGGWRACGILSDPAGTARGSFFESVLLLSSPCTNRAAKLPCTSCSQHCERRAQLPCREKTTQQLISVDPKENGWPLATTRVTEFHL